MAQLSIAPLCQVDLDCPVAVYKGPGNDSVNAECLHFFFLSDAKIKPAKKMYLD
jgi:hypothetical protein